MAFSLRLTLNKSIIERSFSEHLQVTTLKHDCLIFHLHFNVHFGPSNLKISFRVFHNTYAIVLVVTLGGAFTVLPFSHVLLHKVVFSGTPDTSLRNPNVPWPPGWESLVYMLQYQYEY